MLERSELLPHVIRCGHCQRKLGAYVGATPNVPAILCSDCARRYTRIVATLHGITQEELDVLYPPLTEEQDRKDAALRISHHRADDTWNSFCDYYGWPRLYPRI